MIHDGMLSLSRWRVPILSNCADWAKWVAVYRPDMVDCLDLRFGLTK